MKSTTRTLSLFLLATILLIATACTGSPSAPATEAAPSAQAATAAPATQEPAPPEVEDSVPFKETLEFTYFGMIWAPYDVENMPVLEEVQRRTNTKVNFQWNPQADYQTKVATVLASGQLPEVIAHASIPTLIDQGAIIPLDDLMEQYGQNILAAVTKDDYPFWRQSVDGHIYTVPIIQDFPPALSTMVRKDFLDAVKLSAPATWDQWLAYWRAVRDNDANGDGDATNEIPFSLDTAKGTNGLRALMNAFGIACSADGQFCLADGKYTMVYAHPRYRAFLEAARMMYSEKLLDQEFASRDQSELFKIMDNGQLASTMTWAERIRLSNDVLQEVKPEAGWVKVDPIIGPHGDRMIESRAKVTHSATITIQAGDKAGKIIQYYNWIYGEEGRLLTNFGLEGVHHDIKDGKPVLRPEYCTSFVDARKANLVFQPSPFYWNNDLYMQILLQNKTYEELPKNSQLFYDGLFQNEEFYYYQVPTFNTKAYQDNQATVIPELCQNRDGTISGRMSVDEFFAAYEKLADKVNPIIEQGSQAYGLVSR